MRIDRLLAITIMLINRRMITARELADQFDVSIRTIYRDFSSITASGVPIVSYPGVQGGFCIMENYRLSKQVLTLEDMASIVNTLQGINKTIASSRLQAAYEKILNLVPSDKIKALGTLGNELCISIQPWGFNENHKEKLRILQESIASNRCVSLTYTDAKAQTTQRTIEPMTLVFKGYTWYCFGYCRKRCDFRVFKISRIQRIVPLEISFIRKEKEFDDREFESALSAPGIDLVLKFSSQSRPFLLEYFQPEQMESRDDGSLIVRFSLPEDEWLYWWLLQFGTNLEILSPHHLRAILRDRALKIASLYQ